MLRPLCIICGRPTTPFVFVGREPVGPACARKLGITKAKAGRGMRATFADYKPTREKPAENLDLFKGL